MDRQEAIQGIASGERNVQDVISQLMSGQNQVSSVMARNTATHAGSAEAQAAIRGALEPKGQEKTNDLLDDIKSLLADVEAYKREERDEEKSGTNETTGSV